MKAFISKDTVSTVQNYLNNFKPSYSLEKYEFRQFEIFTFGEIQVTKTAEEHYLYFIENVGKDYIKAWNKDVGKVLCKTFKKKKYDHIYELKTDEHKILLRLVDDDEKSQFSDFNVHYVKFGDNEYIILKMNPLHSSYADKDLSLCDIDDIISDEEKYASEEDDDYVLKEEPEPESYSLF